MKKYSDQDSTGQCQVHVVVDLLRIFWRSILKKKYSEENIFLRNILTRTAVDSVRSTWSSGPPENFPPNWINAESETFSIRASKQFSQQVQFSKSFLLKVFWTVSIFFALIFEIKKVDCQWKLTSQSLQRSWPENHMDLLFVFSPFPTETENRFPSTERLNDFVQEIDWEVAPCSYSLPPSLSISDKKKLIRNLTSHVLPNLRLLGWDQLKNFLWYDEQIWWDEVTDMMILKIDRYCKSRHIADWTRPCVKTHIILDMCCTDNRVWHWTVNSYIWSSLMCAAICKTKSKCKSYFIWWSGILLVQRSHGLGPFLSPSINPWRRNISWHFW